MKYKDVKTSSYEIGLTKIVGKKIKEIHGYIGSEYEKEFKITRVEFSDGSSSDVEGEHDYPYIADIDEGILEEIEKSDPDYEPEEDE